MPVNPYTGEFVDDYGIPLSQSAQGQPGSYLPGYGGYDPSQPNPYTGAPITSPGQPWADYQNGVVPPQAPSGAAGPSVPTANVDDTGQTPGGGTGGSGGGNGNPYTVGTNGAGGVGAFDPASFQWPLFDGGQPFSYDPFQAPTAADAENEPGYAFARDQGVKALQNSAAAKGTLRTGGTLKDIIGWGDKFASQNYQGAYDRKANTYQMNRNNAADIFQRNYNTSKDVFAPKERAATNVFDALLQQWRDALSATTSVATAGAGL